MYVVIGGAGDAGRYLGKTLRAQEHEVAFIERDASAAAEASEIDALVVRGDVCDPKVLKEAEIGRSKYYVGLVKDDSANITSCSLANIHGCGTIARIKNPSLVNAAVSSAYANIGVDVALCPPLITASQISRVFAFPSKLRDLMRWGIEIYHVVVEEGSPYCSKPLSKLNFPEGAGVVSVFRGVEQILPTESLILQAEDELCILLDNRAKVEDVERILGISINPYTEVKDVFIAGATKMGLTLAQKLLQSDMSVVIMDMSKERTTEAAESLSKASVIQSDPLGHGVLKKEEIENFDVLMAMGLGMERNLLISVLGKQFGIPTALALVDRIDLKASVEKTLVDAVVVPNLLLVKTITNLFKGSGSLGRKYLQSEEILVKEIKVNSKMRCKGKTLGDFNPAIEAFLIVGIGRNGNGLVPGTDHVISEGDRLFILYHFSGQKTVDRWLVG